MRLIFVFIILLNCLKVIAQQPNSDSLEIALKAVPDDTTRVHILNSLTSVFNQKGEFGTALSYAKAALSLSEKLEYKEGMGNAHVNMVNIYGALSNNLEALKNGFAALKIEEEIGNKPGIAVVYNSIATNYFNQENYHDALKNYQALLAIRKEIGNKRDISISYNNIGNLYFTIKEYPEALKNYLITLKIAEEIGDDENIGLTSINVGTIYQKQNNYAQAMNNYLASLKARQRMGDKHGLADCYITIGQLLIKEGKFKEAKKNLNEGLRLSKETGSRNEIKDSYVHLSVLDSISGNFKEAYQYSRLSSLIKDSIFNEQSSKQISQLRIQYETNKKDNEIQLLSKDKQLQAAQINKQKILLNYLMEGFALAMIFSLISLYFYNHRRKMQFNRQVSEVEMKALRSQMNPHFIFNSLNSIYRFLQQNDNDNASEYLIKFSKLMRLILENSRFQEVSLKEDIEALELYMQLEAVRLNGKFSYEIIVGEDIDLEGILIPPLILQPFVENAIWHGFQNKEGEGRITIQLTKHGKMLHCVVEDNGTGRIKASQGNDKGNEPEKKSLGMKITNARIDIINKIRKTNASVKLIDLTEGLRVEIELPLIQDY